MSLSHALPGVPAGLQEYRSGKYSQKIFLAAPNVVQSIQFLITCHPDEFLRFSVPPRSETIGLMEW